MAPLPHLVLFFGLVFGIVVLPGLDMAYVLASALTGGRAGGLSALLGVITGGMCHVTMGALGVAVVLRTVPAAFNALLVAGALYIGWIGLSLLRSEALFTATEAVAGSRAAVFRRGATTNLLNPKAYLFSLAIFPQFMRPEWGPIWNQAVVLWAIIATVQAGVYGSVALAAAGVRARLERSPRGQRALARAVGGLLVAAALATIVESWRL
jgi:threonine/homoserine/homoserine lactone efflux protein